MIFFESVFRIKEKQRKVPLTKERNTDYEYDEELWH